MGITPTMIMAAAAAVSAGVGIYSAVNQPSMQKATLPPNPQASQTPGAQNVRNGLAGSGQGGGSPGIAQTFLTGPGGVNPAMLQLGSNTLLGGGSGSTSSTMPPPPGMG